MRSILPCAAFLVFPVAAAAAPDAVFVQVERAAREQLHTQAAAAGFADARADVNVVRPLHPLAPCAAAVEVVPLDVRSPARMRFVATCHGSDGWRYELVARATVSASVAVMAAEVAAGHVLDAADVTLERRDITNAADAIADPQSAAGMAAKRTLRTGELLRMSQLVALPLVQRGQNVTVVARRAQVEVSLAAEALDSGTRGAIIRARNANGTVIRARVTAAGLAETLDSQAPTQSSR
jgi:flagella basal body P-ring formation protein FlgA